MPQSQDHPTSGARTFLCLACLLRLLLLLEVSGLAALALYLGSGGQAGAMPWWQIVLLVPLIWILLRSTLPLLSVFLSRRLSRHPQAWSEIGLLGRWRLRIGESWRWLQAWAWLQLWPAKDQSHAHQDGSEQPVRVLLIHGYCCNSGVFRPLIKNLRSRLPVSILNVDLDPLFRDPTSALEMIGAKLKGDRAQGPIIIVGFSMGGVAARLIAQTTPGVIGVITVATPAAATRLGSRRFANGLFKWWKQLAPLLDQAPVYPLHLMSSNTDNIVVPDQIVTTPKASQCVFSGLGHMEMILHRNTRAHICNQIKKFIEDQD